jgi:hypothetical protein
MEMHRQDPHRFLLIAAVVFLAAASDGSAIAAANDPSDVIQLAQAPEPSPRELQPRYEPVPPPEKSWYNSSYIFGMTRGVANSTLVPAVKAPLFVLTVPLDLVFLPFEAIGGCFG